MSDLKYDVFLSFRGEDTRDNFTSHLYAELRRQNIETFIDDKSLERGDEINSSLVEAIEESLIYVVILSEHYASSSWCLNELTEILKCKDRYGREVIPVFYKVDPSNVRHQRQSYADDLAKHHQRFGGKVDAWKASLTQVAELSGWDSQKTRPESTLVTEIVKDIVKKLNRCVSSDYEEMTGIDNHIEKIQSLLLHELPTVQIIGIWGMGGIGKTTIANAIFEKLATQFRSASIIQNVKQEIERAGLDHVKSKYLSKLLGEDNKSSEYNISIDPRLKRMKVLLVFDDVKDSDQLKDLIGTHRNFGEGSRIIVTSRDKQVLLNAHADEIYQVREMSYQASRQLFCSFAFKQNHPKESFVSLTEKVLGYAKGLPLALKVLGSLLNGKTKEVWESQLQKLEKLPDQDILKSLKLSYDGLDKEQKDIFLDIACFHIGELDFFVERTLDGCGYSAARIGMEVLKDRCLIFISEYNHVWMHDLIKEMGQDIVLLEEDPRKRSRLWKTNDIYDVLSKKKGKGTDAIKGISLNTKKIKKIQLDADTFNEMHNLRRIQFRHIDGRSDDLESNVTCSDHLKFPNNLKFLQWDCFPQRSLLQNFWPEDLILVEMRASHLEQLWEGDQALPNLKILDLAFSKKLRAIPDLSLCPNIEKIALLGCSNLEELPEVKEETMKNLKRLWLGETAIKELPSSLDRLVGLEELSLQSCTKLKTIPTSIGNLSKLVTLDLSFCESLETFPEIPNYCLSSLTELLLCGTSIVNLPESVAHLSSLRSLDLSDCKRLECVPNNIGCLSSLTVLSLHGSSIVNLPESIAHLSSLKALDLSYCKRLKCVPKLPPNLSYVFAFDCPFIKRMLLSSSYDSEEGTFEFHLTNCQELDATSWSNIVEEARIKITDNAYKSVFCFPGSAVPDWFPYSCKGNPVTIKNDSTNRLTGLALCVVLGRGDMDGTRFKYRIGIISDRETHYSNHSMEDHTVQWKGKYDFSSWSYQKIFLNEDHTFLWKHELFHAQHITFQFPPDVKVKECGICPLYAKENDDDDDDHVDVDESSGSKSAE